MAASSSQSSSVHHSSSKEDSKKQGLLSLSIGALGVVYGDIGTSPLYALKESLHPSHGITPSIENVYGILSLVFWALMLVVSVKYLSFVLRADKQGEGGMTTLLALLLPKLNELNRQGLRLIVIVLAIFGTGLLYGEGVFTPAISVLSAIEGLEVATPAFKPIVVPLTLLILLGLFWVQKRGTAKIGSIFGPVMIFWFLTLIVTGLPWIFAHPEVLMAMSPAYAIRFFIENGLHGFFVLSSVVLCITGGEALYADMGHFGKSPIRRGWFYLVFPALIINYFGQGAMVLERGPDSIENTFYSLVSGWWIYPLVGIATLAAVIASQALISGAYSLTLQSVQLGFLPRTAIQYTSRDVEGQIYVPKINLFLMVSCISLVLIFGSSTNLAAAYGIAVTGTMTITSVLFYIVARYIWNWALVPLALLIAGFLVVDLTFFSANILKIFNGGWVPIAIAFFVLALMTTWKRGRLEIAKRMQTSAMPLNDFFKKIESDNPARVKGTAVFMTLANDIAPSVLLQHYKHNNALHKQVILLSVITEHEPEIPRRERVQVTPLDQGFLKIIARYGYMESPDMKEILMICESMGTKIDRQHLSFFLGRETFLTSGNSGMLSWRKRLFIFMSRNSRSAAEYFNLPPDQVIEVGSQIQI